MFLPFEAELRKEGHHEPQVEYRADLAAKVVAGALLGASLHAHVYVLVQDVVADYVGLFNCPPVHNRLVAAKP